MDRGALPPMLFGAEFEDREMEMRRLGRGVAGGSYVADHFARSHGHAFVESCGVAIEVGVVVAKVALGVELVNGDAAGFAEEEFLDDTCGDGEDGCSARREKVYGFVGLSVRTAFVEG